jgi:hypothetical protein
MAQPSNEKGAITVDQLLRKRHAYRS